jgi:hypothetical protein
MDHNTITGRISNSGLSGIKLSGATYTKIQVEFEDNGQLETAGDDFDISINAGGSYPSLYTKIIGSAFSTNGKVTSFVKEAGSGGADYTSVIGCDFVGNPKGVRLNLVGTHSRKDFNSDSIHEMYVPFTYSTNAPTEIWRNPCILINADDDLAACGFTIPLDLTSIVSVELIWMAVSSVTNMVINISSNWRNNGDTMNGTTDSTTITKTTTAGIIYQDIITDAFTSITAGTIVGVKVYRPTSGNTNAQIMGLLIKYL